MVDVEESQSNKITVASNNESNNKTNVSEVGG